MLVWAVSNNWVWKMKLPGFSYLINRQMKNRILENEKKREREREGGPSACWGL